MPDTESPKPGTPEYDQAMVDLAENRMEGKNSSAETEPQEDAAKVSHEKPEGIPDKFWNADTGVVDYVSMQKETEYWQKKAQGKTEEKPAEKPEDKPAEKDEEATEEDEAEKLVESKGLDMESLSEEFRETGELSEDSYSNLDKAGIPKEMVDAYIAGQQAIATQQRAAILSDIGGEEEFSSMTEWMANNLSPEEVASYNSKVANKDVSVIKDAISVMHSKYQDATGVSGKQIEGDGNTSNYEGYNSQKEMSDAINDPRYAKDSHYRNTVEAKIKATKDNVF